MTRHLYLILGVLCLLAVLGPALTAVTASLIPLIVVAAGAAVMVRLVWFYTNRY